MESFDRPTPIRRDQRAIMMIAAPPYRFTSVEVRSEGPDVNGPVGSQLPGLPPALS